MAKHKHKLLRIQLFEILQNMSKMFWLGNVSFQIKNTVTDKVKF